MDLPELQFKREILKNSNQSDAISYYRQEVFAHMIQLQIPKQRAKCEQNEGKTWAKWGAKRG